MGGALGVGGALLHLLGPALLLLVRDALILEFRPALLVLEIIHTSPYSRIGTSTSVDAVFRISGGSLSGSRYAWIHIVLFHVSMKLDSPYTVIMGF